MTTSTEEPRPVFPCFIKDKAEGKDLFEGQSQNRIADNIAQFIKENKDNKRKVIGIEGEWGSGKSNVIEILKIKLDQKYFFYVFDAWGHQEDLTRRSILEGLLTKLIDSKVLNGAIWEKELNNLLAKKIEKHSKSIPRLSSAIVLALFGALFTPITRFFADRFLKSYIYSGSSHDIINTLFSFLILSITFIPLLVLIICKWIKSKPENRSNIVGELFSIYKGKEIESTSSETISENEPSVRQFTDFLIKVEKGCKEKNLVIVFDNMDRLPSEKVKEVWSSIHTFFASDDNDITTWAVVPFDNEHICNIFIEDNHKNDHHRTESYIHKTFSIVFHVAPPPLSDWKDFFNNKFEEAFGQKPPATDLIETIFDYHNIDNQKIKPREIICFINDIVALKKLWNDEIPFKYLALFAVKREKIMDDPFNNILNKNYLNSLESLFTHDEHLETYISALAFNVPLNKANEILLKRTIENALKGQGDFNDVCKYNSFWEVFQSAFYNSKLDLIHTISCLNNLPENTLNKEQLITYWEKLSGEIQIAKFDINYIPSFKILVQKVSEKNMKEKILKYLFSKAVSMDDQSKKFYAGKKYYNLILDFKSLLEQVWPEKKIEEVLPENMVAAQEYLEFIKESKEKYSTYKVSCLEQDVNDFLVSGIEDNDINNYSEQIEIINPTTDLTRLKEKINSITPTLDVLEDCEDKVKIIYGLGKILTIESQKLGFKIPGQVASNILRDFQDIDETVELTLSVISEFLNNPASNIELSNGFNNAIEDEELIGEFIKNYKYFFNYTDLITYCIKHPSTLVVGTIKELTKNSEYEIEGNNIGYMVDSYQDIKETIFDDEIPLMNEFISKINSIYDVTYLGLINIKNISIINSIINDNSIVPPILRAGIGQS